PTPISALIHAATMVTAGVFMVARMSPLFEYSDVALSFVLVIGATGALFTGILAIVMHDIKRVIAYSTLSQLGYMMVAMGISAYAAGIFHLATHAAFKALLFLGAGSVILAMHHEQDMRKMGGLRKYMPITYITFLIGGLALAAVPPFAGFYSKDTIIEATHFATIPGATYAYWCVALGAFVTGLYTFRAFFLTFHGEERMDPQTRAHLKESPWVVTLPLIALAIPSVFLGFLMIGPMLYDAPTLLNYSIFTLPEHQVLAELATEYHGPWAMALEALSSPIFGLAMAGIFVAWVCYWWRPGLPALVAQRTALIYQVLCRKYGFDDFNDWVFVRGTRGIGQLFYGVGDRILIDDVMVNGTGRSVRWLALRAHLIQSGYLFHYTTVMVLALLVFLLWLLLG
ncbi:MAG: NADH-quinone oxidoreductase subunit L, partial [Gammaproteobacteria bacterium]